MSPRLATERAQLASARFLAAIVAERTGAPAAPAASTPATAGIPAKRSNRPRAYTGPFPIRSHRTLAQIAAQQTDDVGAA